MRFNMQSCVHSFFFCPTDRPTFTRGRAMGNETFYGDGLINIHMRRWLPQPSRFQVGSWEHKCCRHVGKQEGRRYSRLLGWKVIWQVFSTTPHSSLLSGFLSSFGSGGIRFSSSIYLIERCPLQWRRHMQAKLPINATLKYTPLQKG